MFPTAFQKIKASANLLRFAFFALLSNLILYESSFAQTHFKQTGNSYLVISGTSTLHDWSMTSKDGSCQADFELRTDGTPEKLNSLSFTIPSESLKSGHDDMDKNAYSIMNTGAYKTIKFTLLTASIVNTKINCSGNLTVAGITKQIALEATCKVLPNNSLLYSGSEKIKMSDFQIEAPTFMFGTVTTGDELTVSFNINLAPLKK